MRSLLIEAKRAFVLVFVFVVLFVISFGIVVNHYRVDVKPRRTPSAPSDPRLFPPEDAGAIKI